MREPVLLPLGSPQGSRLLDVLVRQLLPVLRGNDIGDDAKRYLRRGDGPDICADGGSYRLDELLWVAVRAERLEVVLDPLSAREQAHEPELEPRKCPQYLHIPRAFSEDDDRV